MKRRRKRRERQTDQVGSVSSFPLHFLWSGLGCKPHSPAGSRQHSETALQHAEVLLGPGAGPAGQPDCLAELTVSGAYLHLYCAADRALHANTRGQEGNHLARAGFSVRC